MPTTSLRRKKSKGADDMGRVTTEAHIENLRDTWDAERGLIKPGDVRRVTIAEALVDTGATFLSLPKKIIKELGLDKCSEKRVMTSAGSRVAGVHGPVTLTIQGRSCTMDVLELPNSVPALIGQLPLEALDFVVDLNQRKLIGNPAHGGEHIIECY